MESEFDTTGVITKISDDYSIVSVSINDVPKLFSFSKYLLYIFGLQCEGQMGNILDEGMSVDLRFKFSNENVPCIVAVWVSEKPDHLSKDFALKPFYEQKGNVINVSDDNILVQIASSDRNVLISKEVFFRNGYRTKHDSALVIGETVTMDAIPFESEHPTGASYQATCAWVGPAPALVERFGLSILALDDPMDPEDPMQVVHGIVTVIPSEVVAFAELECVQYTGKVMLFRCSFAASTGCDNIKDLISIGDGLCMRIRYEYLFDGSKQLYAAHAWKDGSEVCSNEMAQAGTDGNPIEGAVEDEIATRDVSIMDSSDKSDGMRPQEAVATATRQKRRTRGRGQRGRNSAGKSGTFSDESASTREHTMESYESKANLSAEFDKSNRGYKREVLINHPPLSGIVSIITGNSAYILYDGLKIFVDRKTMFKDGMPLTDDSEYVALVAHGNKEVFFEAVERNSESKKDGFSYEATCVWIGRKPSLMMMRTGSTPKRQVETKINETSRTKSPSAAVKFDETSDVLIGDPPLSGSISLISKNTAMISYQSLKIFVHWSNMYVDGQACTENQFVLAVTTGFEEINFEAIKLRPGRKDELRAEGFTHEASCAWFGRRPGKFCDVPSPVLCRKDPPGISCTASIPVLYRENPPLEGILEHDRLFKKEYPSFHSLDSIFPLIFIRFEGLKIFLGDNITFSAGQSCSTQKLLDLASSSTPIKFEAVKSSDLSKVAYGYSHEATCAWFGSRPGLMTIIKTLHPMNFDLLKVKDRTYRGVVIRFCLPKLAFIYEPNYNTTVGLHVGAFGRKPKQCLDYSSGKDCISSFVKLNDEVEFKISVIPTFASVLSATNVKVVKTGSNTSISNMSKKSAPWTEQTSPRDVTANQVTKLGMTQGIWNPYPIFETSSSFKNTSEGVKSQTQKILTQNVLESHMSTKGSDAYEKVAVRDETPEEAKGDSSGNVSETHPHTERSNACEKVAIREETPEEAKGDILSGNVLVSRVDAAISAFLRDGIAIGVDALKQNETATGRFLQEGGTSKGEAKEQIAHVPVQQSYESLVLQQKNVESLGNTSIKTMSYGASTEVTKEHSSEKVRSPSERYSSFTLEGAPREVAKEESRKITSRMASDQSQKRSPNASKCLVQ